MQRHGGEKQSVGQRQNMCICRIVITVQGFHFVSLCYFKKIGEKNRRYSWFVHSTIFCSQTVFPCSKQRICHYLLSDWRALNLFHSLIPFINPAVGHDHKPVPTIMDLTIYLPKFHLKLSPTF